jgi:hypothetical protein
VDPSDGLDAVERRKFLTPPGLELRPLGRPTRSQSLYRLRYPRSFLSSDTHVKPITSFTPVLLPFETHLLTDPRTKNVE